MPTCRGVGQHPALSPWRHAWHTAAKHTHLPTPVQSLAGWPVGEPPRASRASSGRSGSRRRRLGVQTSDVVRNGLIAIGRRSSTRY